MAAPGAEHLAHWEGTELQAMRLRALRTYRPDDVFHLTLAELHDLPRGEDRRPLAAARRAEMEFCRTISPPATLARGERTLAAAGQR